jgi:hypothetical protein
MQVRRTTVDTSVRRGTGWPGSNPGTLSALGSEGEPTGSTDLAVARLWLSSDRLIAPSVVDHIAPGAVGLTPRHLGRRGAQGDRIAIRSGAA